MKRRVQLERARADAINHENREWHFTSLHQIYKNIDIVSLKQVFHVDESGFLVRNADIARKKPLFECGTRGNAIDIKWAYNA